MTDLTQTRQDLSVLIEVIDNERAALAHIIHANQYYIDSAEDIEEGLEAKLWQAIRENRSKLESLIAWRMIFLNAWEQVKR